jgi:hypothetical protein
MQIKLINNRINKFFKLLLNDYLKYTTQKIDKIYYYVGFEILPYNQTFIQYNNTIDGFNSIANDIYKLNKVEYPHATKKNEDLKYFKSIIDKLQSPPTHIKATHDVATNTTTFEYIYDKLLDEDKGDTFGTYFREWQYQLGKPRPVKNKIPKGHHIEFRTEPQYTYDDQGRVTKIESELVGVIVKDEEK